MHFLFPMVDPLHVYAPGDVLAEGCKGAAGAASGKVVFSVSDAQALHIAGEAAVLILQDPSPADLEGLVFATAVLVMHGGVTSPAAEAAREHTLPAVTGLQGCGMVLDKEGQCVLRHGAVCIRHLDEVTVDGASGRVIRGVVPTVQAGLDMNFLTFMKWVQKFKKMGVFCHARTPDEATKGMELGADGLGSYYIEHVLGKAGNRDLLLGVLMGASK